MESPTNSTGNQSQTTVYMDLNNSRAVEISVPIVISLALIIVGVSIIATIFCYKKWQKSSRIHPLAEIVTDGPNKNSLIENPAKKQQSRASTLATGLLNVSDSDSDNLEVTRSHSQTVIVPEGQKLVDIFVGEVDTGEFREPEEMNGKMRWQIVLLEGIEGGDEIAETVYNQGVYMDWSNTLQDVRHELLDTKQLDENELFFFFLHSDVLGEHIDIQSEPSVCLSKLGRAVRRSRTICIEKADQDEVCQALCTCGKHALFKCIHCQSRGYCSHDCELLDNSHIFSCSESAIKFTVKD